MIILQGRIPGLHTVQHTYICVIFRMYVCTPLISCMHRKVTLSYVMTVNIVQSYPISSILQQQVHH